MQRVYPLIRSYPLPYTNFSRIFALTKSMITTTITIAATAVPAERYLLKGK
jgi:hypothetical protein